MPSHQERVRRSEPPEPSPLADCITPDGGLYSLGWYLGWTPGDERAVLDGEFTAKDLIDIAEHMLKTMPT